MTHFARQQEGSEDFYHFMEHQFESGIGDKIKMHDFVTLGYNFYTVHSGSEAFFTEYYEQMMRRMDD